MATKSGELSPARDLAIKYVRTASLTPYANNAREHSPKQIRIIARSLKEFGWVNPLIVSAALEVLCGHGRLEAAVLLGMLEVPVIVIDDLSEAQRRAYILADNAIATKSSWDRGMLRTELQGLIELGFDVELTGFQTLEIDTILTVGEEAPGPEQELIELPSDHVPALTRLGDHWVVGRHHFMCADATLTESYEQLLGPHPIKRYLAGSPARSAHAA